MNWNKMMRLNLRSGIGIN